MKIKITEKNKERLDLLVESIMNLATVAISKGVIPSERLMKNENAGLWWHRNKEKFIIAGSSNNHWGFIENETDTSVTIRFYYRYDDGKQKAALVNLINALWSEQTQIIK